MLVLIRKISPYDAVDLFLGIFNNEKSAQEARDEYLRSVRLHDPWNKQSYRQVNLDDDVRIIRIEDYRDIDDDSLKAFLVTFVFDGMGQRIRKFDTIFSDRESAELYAKQKESEDYDKAPNWCEVDEVLINLKR